MRPERLARLVARWARCYTRNLPPEVARRRVEEIAADVSDQITQERLDGTREPRIARGIASRMIRGLAADIGWRRTQPRPTQVLHRSAARIALGVGAILSIPLLATLTSEEAHWTGADFAVAGVLLTLVGIILESAIRRAGNLAAVIGVAVLGIAAGLFGQADDAPGMVLLGILLLASAGLLGIRSVRHSR